MRPWVLQAITITCLSLLVLIFLADALLPGYSAPPGMFGLVAGVLSTLMMLTLHERRDGRGGRGGGSR